MAKAIISTTYSDTYLYFLPIVTWCWNKLGVDVICFMPDVNKKSAEDKIKFTLIADLVRNKTIRFHNYFFSAPEHKEATYAQCLRNYGAAIEWLDENELICSSDVDMICFKKPPYNDMLTIWGSDLVPQGQMPMCYINGTVKQWREAFNLYNYDTSIPTPDGVKVGSLKTYQQAIDELLADDECEHYRGCRWSVDQEQSFLHISKLNHNLIPRARPNTQFASNRVDRDDINWRAYVNEDLIDAHLWRPGYADGNFENILELLTMKYPQEDFTWLENYNHAYKQLL